MKRIYQLFYKKKNIPNGYKIKVLLGFLKIIKSFNYIDTFVIFYIFKFKFNPLIGKLRKLNGVKEVCILKYNNDFHCSWKCFTQYFWMAHIRNIPVIVHSDNKRCINKVKKFLKDTNCTAWLIETKYHKFSSISKKLVEKSWINCCSAFLTGFYITKKLQIESFWEIDADDTYFFLEEKKLVHIFEKAEKYAEKKNIDCFSYDMHYTRHNILKNPHWSFGITYIRNRKDYIKILKKYPPILLKII